MNDHQALAQENSRLKDELQALAGANAALVLELAEKKRALEALGSSAQGLSNLATISGDWYWEQDAEHRFILFISEQCAPEADIGRKNSIGLRRWELPGAKPVSSSWEAHRAMLDAHQPFRNFEYQCQQGGDLPVWLSVNGVPVFDGQGEFAGYRGTAHDISLARRAQQAQQTAAVFLDEIIDNVPVSLQLKSVQQGYRVVAWNKAAQALVGLTQEDVLGRTMHELWSQAEADGIHASDLEIARTGLALDFPDSSTVTKERGVIRVHIRKVPLRDAQGVVTHILSTAEDITERLAVEARLSQSEARFRSLTLLSSDWYWEIDTQYRFTQFSVMGARPEQPSGLAAEPPVRDPIMGRTPWEGDNNPRNASAWIAHRAQLDRRETFRNFDYERIDKAGRSLVSCISGEPVYDAAGLFTGYRGVGSDITQRKQMEAALRASETRFRTVVGAMAEGVLLRDAQGRVVDGNASAERILGRTLQQMKGEIRVDESWLLLREDGSLMPEEERPITAALRTGLPQSNVVVCYRKPDGSVLWALLNIQPLFESDGGALSGFVTTITDIGKRKRAETEIVRLNVDLENRVLRRTAQLEAANKELEAFSYSVAHDLRSPLSSINGYSALLQKAVPADAGERARHYLARIRGGVVRMGELTDGLLSLAQLSRTSLNWDTVDISAEAATIIRQCSENEAGREVHATIQPGLVARADRALLRQVLQNLIANAWKFSSKNPRAEIFVGSKAGADQQTVYFVRDNGAGFDMAYADKLFGTFQRLHSPEEFSGSGIGLATVQRIITRHGGRIWANSALGEGSTFCFTLGCDEAAAKARTGPRDEEGGIALAQAPRARHLLAGTGEATAVVVSVAATGISSDNDAFPMNEQQFGSAFEHAAIGMALIGVNSSRLRVNSAFCQMLGYSEAEMLSRSLQEVTHPDDLEWDQLQRRRALAGEIETYHWEKRYLHHAGHIVWGYLSCSLVRDADRKPLHFIMQVQDITERKAAEKTLRESEERFRALTELSSDWFWEQDAQFRFTQITGNPTDTGRDKVSALGKTRWELEDVAMVSGGWAAHQRQLERHEAFRDFEIIRLDPEGKPHYESVSGVPVFDAAGVFAGYHGTGRDMTEMRRITEALRASDLQLRDITDTVPAFMSYVDADQRFRFCNRAYAEGLGLTRAQIDGKTMREVLGEEGYALARPSIEEVMKGYPVVFERSRKAPNGDQRDFIINYSPRYGDGVQEGRVVGFYSLANDVTELKRLDRMKSEFVSTVSHELRTPLTSIRGSLGLISGGVAGELPPAVSSLVAIAKNNCERLIRLINDILDIEKMESGQIRLELRAHELRLLLQQALAANQGLGTTHQVTLKLQHFPEGGLTVQVDSDRLTQVMTNLLSNAVKFSPPGGSVEVHVLRRGANVRIEVRDHGPGISDEFRKRIFQKFSQADASDTRQLGGTGLGLSISRAIVERLGGSIGFSSEPGLGATFFIELPEWRQPAEPAVVLRSAGPARPRVLVCEDDHDVARLIGMMLDKGGFDADLACSAAQAQAHVAQTRYAAMTVDLKLPDQDGITLIRNLRRQEGTRDLPIVVVSAVAGEGQIQFNNELLSVSDWLDKPIDENQLILGLRRAISGMASVRPRILHVEDDLDIQRVTAAIGQDFANFEFAATLQEARARLADQSFDLVLLDLGLPGESGWDLLADIHALTPPPPVVVFSASDVSRTEGARAAAVLIKASCSNDDLLQTLQRVLDQAQVPAAPRD